MRLLKQEETEMETKVEQCYCCEGTGEVDEGGMKVIDGELVDGGWTKEPCPVCAKPRTTDEYEAKRQEMLELMDSIKGYKPAWMDVS
jgi:hypothetical protein